MLLYFAFIWRLLLRLQVMFDLLDFNLHSNENDDCDIDFMTIINSEGGTGGRFCGTKS